MLVDSRPGDNTGVVLEHPLFDQLRDGGEELPNSLTRLRVENVASYGASAILFTDPIADDVEGREFQGLWIAAAEPVTRLSERAMETDFHSNAPERDVSSPPNRIATGLYVLAAEDYSSVIRPVRELTRQLTWLGWGAIGFFLIVALGMWLFVMRLLAESRERLGRAYSMSVDSSLIVTGGGIDGDIVEDPFRTVGQSASDAAPD